MRSSVGASPTHSVSRHSSIASIARISCEYGLSSQYLNNLSKKLNVGIKAGECGYLNVLGI